MEKSIKYLIRFEGTEINAIGAPQKFSKLISAPTFPAAVQQLYQNYSHIKILTVNGYRYKPEQSQV